MILPDRYCSACDVLWDSAEFAHCWLCSGAGEKRRAPETPEECADANVNALLWTRVTGVSGQSRSRRANQH